MADSTAVGSTPANGAETPVARLIEVTNSITIPVVNRAGAEVGTVSIDPAEFGGKISRQLMHDVVLMYLANQRAGTHHTLRRGQVAGSTKKLFRQKGTGNARAGTKRTNKRRGGGTAKGPKPRDYEYHLSKQSVKAATRMAVLSKFMDGQVVVIDDLTFGAPKTKEMAGFLKAIKIGKKPAKAPVTPPAPTSRRERRALKAGAETPPAPTAKDERELTLADTTVLIGTDKLDPNVYKSARNLQGVKVLPAAEFNCYTVLKQRRLVLTRSALEVLRTFGKAKDEETK